MSRTVPLAFISASQSPRQFSFWLGVFARIPLYLPAPALPNRQHHVTGKQRSNTSVKPQHNHLPRGKNKYPNTSNPRTARQPCL